MLRCLMIVCLIVAPPMAVAVWEKWPEVRPYPRRFAAIEEGKLYRGAYPSGRNIRNLHQNQKIKTIVSLTGKVNDAEERETLAAAEELGIRVHRFPMPGDGRGEFATLDMAADALARQDDWPIFFHCKAGEQRSNATLAAWRMRHCGYTLEQALDELITQYNLEPHDEKEQRLVEHLTRYARRHLGLSGNASSAAPAEGAGQSYPAAEAGAGPAGNTSEN
jgi:hypothetical protein